jgi:hypothetical protein
MRYVMFSMFAAVNIGPSLHRAGRQLGFDAFILLRLVPNNLHRVVFVRALRFDNAVFATVGAQVFGVSALSEAVFVVGIQGVQNVHSGPKDHLINAMAQASLFSDSQGGFSA